VTPSTPAPPPPSPAAAAAAAAAAAGVWTESSQQSDQLQQPGARDASAEVNQTPVKGIVISVKPYSHRRR